MINFRDSRNNHDFGMILGLDDYGMISGFVPQGCFFVTFEDFRNKAEIERRTKLKFSFLAELRGACRSSFVVYATMAAGRPSGSVGCDVPKSVAFDFFRTHLKPTDQGPKAVWPYSKGQTSDWKRSVVLSEIKKTVHGI